MISSHAECRYNVDKHDDDHDEVKCDPLTSTKSITLALKPGSPDTCPATKTITKECGKLVRMTLSFFQFLESFWF